MPNKLGRILLAAFCSSGGLGLRSLNRICRRLEQSHKDYRESTI